MRTSIAVRSLLLSLLVLLGTSEFGSLSQAAAATLTDFGHASMIVDRQPPLGPHPLLVVLFNVANGVPYDRTHTVSYYDSLVFNLAAPRSINGYHWENSNKRFFWTRAGPGVIGPINLTTNEGYFATAQRAGGNPGLTDLLYYSNLVARTMISGAVNLAQFDNNSDGTVSADELHFLFVLNEPAPASVCSIAARAPGCVRPPGFSYSVCPGWAAGIQVQTGLFDTTHELTHTLGSPDLYGTGCLSDKLTLMSCEYCVAEDRRTAHLDSWHKLRFGWSEPRIRSLRAGGVETISAVQMANPNAPVILYDPLAGTGEYFILEYRTRASPNGPGYDGDVAGEGLVVWHVKQDANHNAVDVPRLDAGLIPAQNLWRWCSKCQGLHYISNDGSPIFGSCPEGGLHSRDGSTGYLVVNNVASAPGQHGWRWCRKCYGLFFGPGESASHCPAGTTHDGSQSGDYSLVQNDSNAPGQKEWRWCQKCQGIFHGPGESQSDCPADHARHDGSQGGNYALLLEGADKAVWAEGAPSLARGGTVGWNGGAITPYLRWIDGSQTRTRLYVRPFNPGDGSITVEWWAEEATWVDFNYVGSEFGTFANPFNTLGEGVAASPWGGFVKLKPGSTSETLTINKRVNLEAVGGPVTIGRFP